ncbi:hypothetical protein AB0K18_11275 [Nonomuraea sp. NPDC049421]|uniref:hypothetical protein n=1 Tax=Nonomuraea sp. NPDC049421 TaxID=3155275 RepID=UPI00344AA3A5
MPTLENELRRLMAEETADLHAAPDLLDRVVARTRSRRRRLSATAAALSVAVIAAMPVGYVAAGSLANFPDQVTVTPEPPAIDDTPPVRSDPPDFGDLGDGREFGHVKVGYLPKRLQWKHWSIDYGDAYSTSYDYKGDKNGFYCVQIYMYENDASLELTDRIEMYRSEGDGEDVTVGGRAGYLVIQNVGEDGMKGTPTLFVQLKERQWAEISFSPTYAKDLESATRVEAELRKIGQGLSSTL